MTFDPTAVEAWLDRVYSDAPGFLSVAHAPKDGPWGSGSVVPTAAAALERIIKLEGATPQGIYLRTTTLARKPDRGRGVAADSLALPGLWADVDFGTEGHKPGAGDRLPLPPDEDAARAIVTTSGLPAPSLWVHSGGGLYPWWLLDQPAILDDTTRPQAADVSAQWQQALKRSAERLGYEYGAGVGDLPRVLRIPGTVNRKTDTDRPCRVVEDTGTAYTLDELLAGLTAATPALAHQPAPAPRTRDVLQLHTGASAFDTLDAHVTFDDVLTGAGWARHDARHSSTIEQCWTRPGDPDSPCSAHTLTANPHVLVVFSELAGLPTGGGRALTRGRVFAHLHHGGDERAAAVDIFAAIGGRASTPAAAALPLPRSTMPPSTYGLGDLGEHDVTTQQRQREHHEDSATTPPPSPPAADEPWAQPDPADVFAARVEQEAERQRIRDAARAVLEQEKAGRVELPPLVQLDAFLATPDPETTHRIEGLWPSGGRVLLAAPPKAGKTTTVGNLLRSLADGDPFLDEHHTTQARRILLLDNELDENMLRRWLREHGIANTDRIELVALRGKLSAFNIVDPTTRSLWAQHLGAADVLIFDCLRPALDALGLSEDKEAGRFLEAFDELTQEAGIPESLVVHHMGHAGERSRGDSRLIDWPDAGWRLVKDAEDDDDQDVRRVYFTALGRDVNQPESLLAYQPHTRRLTVAGGTRRDTRSNTLLQPILTYLAANPGVSGNAIEKAVEGKAVLIRDALKTAVDQGLIQRRSEKRGNYYTLTSSPSSHLVQDEGTNHLVAPRPLVYRTRDEDEGTDDTTTTHTPGRGRTAHGYQRAYIAGREQWVHTDTGDVLDEPPTQQESA
ncbi:ATP-binding protein [Janibacter melonis]|uniref:AAA family ATPase n=1 Tax=Janibacter melonis TaxID=262209 RepID=UPI0017835630|nr:hypothetical protein [Janibacter melonis]